MNIKRRTFLNIAAGIIISMSVPLLANRANKKHKLGNGLFSHGVASGDPLKDKVILWTRVTPKFNQNRISVLYEVSKESNFKNIYRLDSIYALKENDYTIKIDLQELESDTKYYYRFKTKNATSTVGETKTLPIKTDKITLAIFSCANYTNGYFNAYRDASSFNQIDAVVHLGDYIYEYGMLDEDGKNAYGTKNAKKIGRELPQNNSKELFTLKDYRLRYALYRSDPDLQDIHAKFPFIVVWDDHEIANNAYKSGIDNKQENQQEYMQRKANAIKAYYEWLPIRPPYEENREKIYRTFHFGELFSLYMLDTRVISRTRQLNYKDYFNNDDEEFNLKEFQKDLKKETHKLLGDEQLLWLEKELKESSTQWQLIGQQIKISPSYVPLEIIKLHHKYEKTQSLKEKELIKKNIFTTLEEIAHIKTRCNLKDPSLLEEELKRLGIDIPYNLDAWDGYPTEREKFYSILKENSNATVILSGDAHFSWSNRLIDSTNNMIGIELGVTSVSSPGLEENYDLKDKNVLKKLENSMNIFDKDSIYNNQTDRGYLIVEIEKSEIKAHWRYINNINSREYNILNNRNTTMRIALKDGRYFYRVH